ncbi:hypothetical protein [Flavobacterium cerinum]|uniref:hypothetical protein n=1 Tax=Flavobacterium cerinum TaxID=2502784 RepID=UPI0013E36FEA|nr:hypothetical protein [Flavobacterium cerinum]
MSVKIIEVEKDEHYNVNDKPVYKDANNNWIAEVELTTYERETFTKHLFKLNEEKLK